MARLQEQLARATRTFVVSLVRSVQTLRKPESNAASMRIWRPKVGQQEGEESRRLLARAPRLPLVHVKLMRLQLFAAAGHTESWPYKVAELLFAEASERPERTDS